MSEKRDTSSSLTKMDRINDLFSLAFGDLTEITTGEYRPLLLSDLLLRLYRASYKTGQCPGRFYIDDAAVIAQQAYPAVRHIVESPGYERVRTDEKVSLRNFTRTDAKTMKWLSGRAGKTFAEKIYPENRVLTSRQKISYDTPENRAALWLYREIIKAEKERWYGSACENCKKECPFYGVRTMRGMIRLAAKIKNGYFSGVTPERQTVQNNRLMCDKYYRVIWDCSTRMLSRSRHMNAANEEIQKAWETAAVWYFISQLIYKEKGLLLCDDLVRIKIESGLLEVTSLDNNPGEKIKVIQVFYDYAPINSLFYNFEVFKKFHYKGVKHEIPIGIDLPLEKLEDLWEKN